MKVFKMSLLFIFSFLTFQLLAADKGTNTTIKTNKPTIIDITVVYIPEYPLPRTIAPYFEGKQNAESVVVEVIVPGDEAIAQIVNENNEVVAERAVNTYETSAVTFDTTALPQGEYKIVLTLTSRSSVYEGVFHID